MKIKSAFGLFAFLLLTFGLYAQPCTISVSATSPSVCPGYQATLTASGANSYTWFTTGGPVVSQSITGGAGTYSVAGSTGTCIAGTSYTIGMAPPLSLTVTPSGAITCIASNFPKYSNPVTFTASGASSYVWLPYNSVTMTYSIGPITTVRPPVSTCYTLTGFTSVCSGSAVACVTVIPQFTITASPAQQTICVGDWAPLIVTNVGTLAVGPSSAFTYSWTEMYGPNLTSPLSYSTAATPSVAQTYTVEVGDANKCVSEPEHTFVHVESCLVGIAKLSSPTVRVFPNPSNESVQISSDKFFLSASLSDIRGSEIQAPLLIAGDDVKVQVERLPPGLYFLTLRFIDGSNSTVKIIRN